MEKEIFLGKRFAAIAGMILSLAGMSCFFAIYHKFTIDQILAVVFFHCILFPILILFLESERKKGHLLKNETTCYTLLLYTFVLSAVAYLIFIFLPAYTAPVMIPAFFLTLVTNPTVGIVIGMYFNIFLGMISESSFYELAAYLILTLFGSLLSILFEKEKYRIQMAVLVIAVSVSIPGLMYFIGSYDKNTYVIVLSGISGVVSAAIFLLLYEKVAVRAGTERDRSLTDIIAPEFPLAKEIREYSDVDYLHACNVSKIAYQCALQVGADPDVAAAAGFYYRVGKLEGEPFVENGVLLAKQNNFPPKVITILSEYNGERYLPSSRESAIVHMVDAVIAKFEFLDKDTLSNTWNHSILVYQTLDEISSKGIYDESGLSMNQFLKIREYLVKGVKLI